MPTRKAALLLLLLAAGGPLPPAVALAAGSCFADGEELLAATRYYIWDGCAEDSACEVGRKYGWPMNAWCVGGVADMAGLFANEETFDEDISGWDTSGATSMDRMFQNSFEGIWSLPQEFTFNGGSVFNGNLSKWNVSNVRSMKNMFRNAYPFNGDVSGWNVGAVTSMEGMFANTHAFNGDLTAWNVSNVGNMKDMFFHATKFNGDISDWDISNVDLMSRMFTDAVSFNQDLCAWRENFTYHSADNMFFGSGCTFRDTPRLQQRRPFCASSCRSDLPSSSPGAGKTSPSESAPKSSTPSPTKDNTDLPETEQRGMGPIANRIIVLVVVIVLCACVWQRKLIKDKIENMWGERYATEAMTSITTPIDENVKTMQLPPLPALSSPINPAIISSIFSFGKKGCDNAKTMELPEVSSPTNPSFIPSLFGSKGSNV